MESISSFTTQKLDILGSEYINDKISKLVVPVASEAYKGGCEIF